MIQKRVIGVEITKWVLLVSHGGKKKKKSGWGGVNTLFRIPRSNHFGSFIFFNIFIYFSSLCLIIYALFLFDLVLIRMIKGLQGMKWVLGFTRFS